MLMTRTTQQRSVPHGKGAGSGACKGCTPTNTTNNTLRNTLRYDRDRMMQGNDWKCNDWNCSNDWNWGRRRGRGRAVRGRGVCKAGAGQHSQQGWGPGWQAMGSPGPGETAYWVEYRVKGERHGRKLCSASRVWHHVQRQLHRSLRVDDGPWAQFELAAWQHGLSLAPWQLVDTTAELLVARVPRWRAGTGPVLAWEYFLGLGGGVPPGHGRGLARRAGAPAAAAGAVAGKARGASAVGPRAPEAAAGAEEEGEGALSAAVHAGGRASAGRRAPAVGVVAAGGASNGERHCGSWECAVGAPVKARHWCRARDCGRERRTVGWHDRWPLFMRSGGGCVRLASRSVSHQSDASAAPKLLEAASKICLARDRRHASDAPHPPHPPPFAHDAHEESSSEQSRT